MAAVLHSSTLGNLNTGVWTRAHDGAPNYTDPRAPIAASSPLSSSDTSDLTPSYNMGRYVARKLYSVHMYRNSLLFAGQTISRPLGCGDFLARRDNIKVSRLAIQVW